MKIIDFLPQTQISYKPLYTFNISYLSIWKSSSHIYIWAKGFPSKTAGPNWNFNSTGHAGHLNYCMNFVGSEITFSCFIIFYYFFIILGGIFIYKCFPVIIFIKLWLQFIFIFLIAFIVNSLLLLLFL